MKHNPTAPVFSIALKGKTYVLHFSRSDYADAEFALGKPLVSTPQFFEEVSRFNSANGTPPMKYLEIALFVGLQRYINRELVPEPQGEPENPLDGLTFRQLRDYVEDIPIDELFAEVIKGMFASMPEADQQQEVKPDAAPLAAPPGGTEPGPSAESASG